MPADVCAKARAGQPTKNGTVVVHPPHVQVGGSGLPPSHVNSSRIVPNQTDTTIPLYNKYDNRFDDPSYYG